MLLCSEALQVAARDFSTVVNIRQVKHRLLGMVLGWGTMVFE